MTGFGLCGAFLPQHLRFGRRGINEHRTNIPGLVTCVEGFIGGDFNTLSLSTNPIIDQRTSIGRPHGREDLGEMELRGARFNVNHIFYGIHNFLII